MQVDDQVLTNLRDPRWGRGMETYGEDPFLTGRMAVAFIQGMQGDDPHYFKVIATAKHFAVHSGPETTRHQFDARPSERDLNQTYLPAFRAAIMDGKADSVMCSYNSVDGVPACANTDLLREKPAREWGFQGYVVSDCGAISDIFRGHKYKATAAEASAVAVKAGTDLTCGNEYRSLVEAVKAGLIRGDRNRPVAGAAVHGALQAGDVRPAGARAVLEDSVLGERFRRASPGRAGGGARIHRAAEERGQRCH